MDYLIKNNKFIEDSINEIISDRLFKGGCLRDNIDGRKFWTNYKIKIILLSKDNNIITSPALAPVHRWIGFIEERV